MAETFVSTLIPCEIRLPPGVKLHLSDSPLLDICPSYEDHSQGFKVPHGVKIVSSGKHASLSEAEETAKALAASWTALMCFTMGVKAAFPRPLCLLERLDKKGRYRARMYFYNGPPLAASRELSTEMLALNWERIVALPKDDARERVALAIRWYTLGLGEADDTTRFLAHWIGLEAIGDLLHNRFHRHDRVHCQVCQHPAGKSHRGSKGGMKHVLSLVSGRAHLYAELDDVRDKMFHGLQDLQLLSQSIADNVGLVETALARAILGLIKPEDSNTRSSAGEPLRTVGVTPQVILDGTFVDLSDEERDLILYTSAFAVSFDIASGKNEEDGNLLLSVNVGLSGPESLVKRFVDQKVTLVSLPGFELHPANNG